MGRQRRCKTLPNGVFFLLPPFKNVRRVWITRSFLINDNNSNSNNDEIVIQFNVWNPPSKWVARREMAIFESFQRRQNCVLISRINVPI